MNMLFDFRSQKQRDEDAAAFRDKMYPFGQHKVKWEEETFNELFAYRKRDIPLLRYSAINHREQTLNNNSQDKEWHKAVKIMRMSKEEIKTIELINKIEIEAQSVDELPTIDQLREILKQDA